MKRCYFILSTLKKNTKNTTVQKKMSARDRTFRHIRHMKHFKNSSQILGLVDYCLSKDTTSNLFSLYIKHTLITLQQEV